VVRDIDGCRANIRFEGNGKTYPVVNAGLGSAFFVNSDGYLVTNAHMAMNTKTPDDCKTALIANYLQLLARDYGEDPHAIVSDRSLLSRVLDRSDIENFQVISEAVLPNGTMLPFEIKAFGAPTGQDEGKDVAVLKVEVKNAPTLKMADSSGVQVLQRVIAVGYPSAADSDVLDRSAALEPSFTDGKISAIKPSSLGTPLLQHSAAATHGSSGGPLLNEAGEVIGITTFRGDTVQGQEVQGFTFAVPSNTAMEYLRTAGTTNQAGTTDQAYRDGLELFWNGHYEQSISKFGEVKRLFPQHSEVDRLITAAQQAISTGVPPTGLGTTATAQPFDGLTGIKDGPIQTIGTAALLLLLAWASILGRGFLRRSAPKPDVQ
jgi:S1-C subfamily serine protease